MENKLRERNQRKELIECINTQYLSTKSLKEYINIIEEEDIKGELWNDFKKVFINNLEKIEDNRSQIMKMKNEEQKRKEEEQKRNEEEQKRKEEEQKRKEEEERQKWKQHYLNGSDYFNGILNYLERKYGKDLLGKKIINLTASSTTNGYELKSILDYNNDNVWFSECPSEYQWLWIDMINHPIKLNGYSIQSNHQGYYLKSWIIEGSNDDQPNKKWEEIDKRVNNNDLNGSNNVSYFRISKNSQSFRYIRLRMIDKNHSNSSNNSDYYLGLSKLELFGDLYESNN